MTTTSLTARQKDALGVLRQARDLLTYPRNWMQGGLAGSRTSAGLLCKSPTLHASHNCFCLLGALCKVTGADAVSTLPLAGVYAKNQLEQELRLRAGDPQVNLSMFNDASSTSHDDVMDLLDETIARMEGRPIS